VVFPWKTTFLFLETALWAPNTIESALRATSLASKCLVPGTRDVAKND
jgi:hypothetical protein